MSRLSAGVVIVTTLVDEQPWGLTVSACCSVSVDPPLLLVSLAESTASTVAIRERRRFGVSVLGAGGLAAAKFAAAPGQAKFITDYCTTSPVPADRTPAIAGALAHFHCAVDQSIRAGDHVLFIGRVGAVESALSDPGDRDGPLVHYRRQFFSVSDPLDASAGVAARRGARTGAPGVGRPA
jgi:flavin reductase (DIM6/NTAB) family NADH-FMN oxidoreductase RutF